MRQEGFGEPASDPFQVIFRFGKCNSIKHEIPNRVGMSHERDEDDPLLDIFVCEIVLQMFFGFRNCDISYLELMLFCERGEPFPQRMFAVGLKMAV